MGLYKLCKHKGRAMDRCRDPWWGSFQYKGRLYRESLGRWADSPVPSKGVAGQVFDRMKDAIRTGTFQEREGRGVHTFVECANEFVKRHVELRGLRSADQMKSRLEILRKRWANLKLSEIQVAEIEDLISDLKAKKRKPATVNRWLALLRKLMNWAVGRNYIERSPFRRGSQSLIKFEAENNRRTRRVSPDEEARLLDKANDTVRQLVTAALDTGLRRGELLKLQFRDIDLDTRTIHVRPENAKSKKSRVVPISTTRLRTLLEYLRLAGDGQQRPDDAYVFTRGDNEALKSFRVAWELARKRAGLEDVRFHDLRSEYASRLVENGVALSQVRDLLGHCSIVVTERYDRQTFAALQMAVATLDDGQPFKILSRSTDTASSVESTSSTH